MWRAIEPVEKHGLWHSMVACSGVTENERDVVTEIYRGTGQVHATREQAVQAAKRIAELWNKPEDMDV